jgi:hypothetical protein
MSQPDLAHALARLDEHHRLHLPLRRGDLLGRLALRFLWKRNLKWQMETNIATRDAVQTIQHIVQDVEDTLRHLRSKIEPVADSIGDGMGVTLNADIGPELEALRRSDQNIQAGLNQRIYAAVGGIRAELSDLRLELADRQISAGEFELRLKEAEAQLAKLAAATRDMRLRHTHVDVYLDGLRTTRTEHPETSALPDRGSFVELAVCELLDGPAEEAGARRHAYLPLIEEVRTKHPTAAVFDMSPGRGEWLEALRNLGITAEAASPNPYVVRHCASLGIELTQAEPLDALAAQGQRSLAAITAFRYVERLDPVALTRFIDLAATLLRRGGVLIVETPHAGGPAARDFHLDPFATRPVHPDLLRFLVDAAGFATAEVRYVDDGPLACWPQDPLASGAEKADRYSLIAWR